MTRRGGGAVVVVMAVGAVWGCGGGGADPGGAARVPEPPAAGLRVGAPEALDEAAGAWAPVARAAAVRAEPRAGAPVVAEIAATTPEGTRNIVALADERGRRAAPAGWVRVRPAALPNGTTGWVPRSALGGYEVVDTRLVVDLGAESIALLRGGRTILSAPVGVGTADAPTPTGEFYVRSRLTRYASPAYGPVAFGTSARSPSLTDWPAGGFVGIHGTDRPDLLPGRVSHGCIRMRNEDILRLAELLPIGTPLSIRGA